MLGINRHKFTSDMRYYVKILFQFITNCATLILLLVAVGIISPMTIFAQNSQEIQEYNDTIATQDELLQLYAQETNIPKNQNPVIGELSDYKKIKRLRTTGLALGISLGASGHVLTVFSLIYFLTGAAIHVDNSTMRALFFSGLLAEAAGATTLITCMARAHKLQQKSAYSVYTVPLYERIFQLNNGTSLSTGVDFIRVPQITNMTAGIGIRYNF